MKNYLDLCQLVLDKGALKSDRTGTGTLSLNGVSLKYDLREGFPLLTTKLMGLKTIFTELLFFIQGRTNNQWLNDRKVHIWDEWAYHNPEDDLSRPEHGELGPVYGAHWRNWTQLEIMTLGEVRKHWGTVPEPGHVIELSKYHSLRFVRNHAEHGDALVERRMDQYAYVCEHLANKSDSRRLIVSAWNPHALPVEGKDHQTNIETGKQVLPPCHSPWQVIVEPMTLEQIYSENDLNTDIVGLLEYEITVGQASGERALEIVRAELERHAPGLYKTHYLNLIMSQR